MQAYVQIKVLSKQANELSKKAEEIENSVYDLKAVNPNIKPPPPPPPPDVLLGLIEAKSKEVSKALEALRK